jgi:hypothetical protein
MENLDWSILDFGTFSAQEVKDAVADEAWQKFRNALKGVSLHDKWLALRLWLRTHKDSKKAKIQVTNYVNALRRAGSVPKRNPTPPKIQ